MERGLIFNMSKEKGSNMNIIAIVTIIDLVIMCLGLNYIKANYMDHALLLGFVLLSVVVTASIIILKSIIRNK